MRSRKAQFTLEFIMIFSIAFFIFLILGVLVNQVLDESREKSEENEMKIVSEHIRKNIHLVSLANNNFNYKISIENSINDKPYDAIIDNDVLYINTSEFMVLQIIPNTTVDYDVNGYLQKGCNIIEKQNDEVVIKAC